MNCGRLLPLAFTRRVLKPQQLRCLPPATATATTTSLHHFSSNGGDDISQIRKPYNSSKDTLLEKNIEIKEPFTIFKQWLTLACNTSGIDEPNAMTLATVTAENRPAARMVLLKYCDSADGFTFFTNSRSAKGQQLAANPHAALVFYWEKLNRSVRVEGRAGVMPDKQCSDYYALRPRESQIAAHVSEYQSAPIASRDVLLERFEALEERYGSGGEEEVPRPDFWCGYTVKPERFEFWQGQSTRMHDRIAFEKRESGGCGAGWLEGDGGWSYIRLEP